MMKLMALALTLIAWPTQATTPQPTAQPTLSCSIDDQGHDRRDLPINRGPLEYKTHTASIQFHPGGPLESQKLLQITLDGSTSSIYFFEPDTKALYLVSSPEGIQVQCSFR